MADWLEEATTIIESWITHQMAVFGLPGCSIAIVRRGVLAFARAYGVADLSTGEKLTPKHRFRIASHSKTFTAAGLLKLRDQGRIRLDDQAGAFISGLHANVARARISQILAHAAGLVRDGADAGHFMDRRPFPSREEILADLKKPQPLEAGRRFKYSNHGFALAGMILEKAAGESYEAFMTREILRASGLRATTIDMPARRDFPFAKGHSLPLADGARLVIPADHPSHAVAPAGGFVATPSDVARFFATLAPDAPQSVLSRESRLDMSRRYHRDDEGPVPLYYGLGTIIGPQTDDWDWFGHSGSFQGTLSRTAIIPAHHVTVSVMTNGLDGLATLFVDGIISILKTHFRRGAADRMTKRWRGRFYSLWGPVELAPVAGRVLIAAPGAFAPLAGAPEIQPIGRDKGVIVKGSSFGSVGEKARIERDGRQRPVALWVGGARLLPRAKLEAELRKRFGGRRRQGRAKRR